MTLAVNIAQGGSNNVTMRNRIINGAMVIDQRNAGAVYTMTGALNAYILDRWKFWSNGGGGTGAVYTVQQSSTAPTGFSNSSVITVTGTSTISGTVYNAFAQVIEGYNVADLNWGATAASAGQTAKSVTLSFWVRSSLTGTFGGALSNSAQDRSYPFTYTISSANTWEQKTITVAGDTSGTWLTTNGIGLYIFWSLGIGASYSGTAGAWAGTTYLSATGTTSLVATNGATLYITGVQLEAGTTASPFEYRQYGTELLLCQRYCENIIASGTNPPLWSIQAGASNNARGGYFYKVQKRTSPSFTNLIGTSYISQFGSGNFTPSAVNLAASNPNGMLIDSVCTGLTTGQAGFQLEGTLTAGTIICLFTAEL
jgi:hypothetical protein